MHRVSVECVLPHIRNTEEAKNTLQLVLAMNGVDPDLTDSIVKDLSKCGVVLSEKSNTLARLRGDT